AIVGQLSTLSMTVTRLAAWAGDDAPTGILLVPGAYPIIDRPLPRFLDDAAATKLLRAARADPDPVARLCLELLARPGLPRGASASLMDSASGSRSTSLDTDHPHNAAASVRAAHAHTAMRPSRSPISYQSRRTEVPLLLFATPPGVGTFPWPPVGTSSALPHF